MRGLHADIPFGLLHAAIPHSLKPDELDLPRRQRPGRQRLSFRHLGADETDLLSEVVVTVVRTNRTPRERSLLE